MSKRVRSFNTRQQAKTFIEGVEFVNDSAIRVERHQMEVWIFDEDDESDPAMSVTAPRRIFFALLHGVVRWWGTAGAGKKREIMPKNSDEARRCPICGNTEHVEEDMKDYRVTWEIDVSAKSPREAAVEAERNQLRQISRTDGTLRGVFSVAKEEATGEFQMSRKDAIRLAHELLKAAMIVPK